MQKNSQPSIIPAYLPSDPDIASAVPHIDPTSSSLVDWSEFLDFDIDEALNTSFLQSELGPGPEPEPETEISHSPQPENLGRIRKRDPRLLCPNFAAGRIPCACPELDKQLEEQEQDEAAAPGKKRARTARASSGGPLRCQVPGCEADISELKGYHKRHRVCLQCAHASSVMLDGEEKRYCQQCGKFHVLSNFDEGKRSCRMKLDIHNRRRKKFNDSKGGTEKEAQQVMFSDDVKDDDDTDKDGTSLSSQSEERETLLEPAGRISTICSAPSSQNLQGESVVTFDTPREIQNNGQKQSPNSKHSASYPDNKNKFSSVCPAGRISFKLYDWNPAEFPRRLRLQIFEWLASMPVELEGYIRPGCTILTAFIAMPMPIWLKLKERPALYIKDLVTCPGNMLFGRGTMLVYLNDVVFSVTRDSIIQVKVKDRSPKLHYIYPTCFEAGRPMEFVACGSNLLQSKFRFLVSFAGRYLAYNISVSSLCCKKGNSNNFDHQLLKISIPQTDLNIFGPAFIEVENQSGLSNFIPILIGDKETCAEMEILQRKSDSSLPSQEQQHSPPMPSCEVLAARQKQFSGFVLDVAWSLKKPVTDQPLTSLHIQRFNYLLDFLIEKESSAILERVFCSLKSALDINFGVAGISDSDMNSLREKMGIAQSMLGQKLREEVSAVMPPLNGVQETKEYNDSSSDLHDTIPLINVAGVVNIHNRPRKSCSLSLSRTFITSRPLIMAITTVCICLGVCVALFHPRKASEIATTIRRCLFGSS